MTFNTSISVESTSSDIPAELSKHLQEPVELSDIEMDDEHDGNFSDCCNDSPHLSSDCEISISDPKETQLTCAFMLDGNISMMKQLEKLEELARNLEAMCEMQTKKTEEVEEEMRSSKLKDDETACEQKRNSKSSAGDIHSQKLMQFINTALNSDDPSIRYTDDFRKTEFKVIDPEKFAEKWGKQKGKETMTVRKLSRSFTYLVKSKQQLRKISKWRYRIINSQSVDFTCSRESSPYGESSSENTVDMYYESAEHSPTDSELSSLDSSFNSPHGIMPNHFNKKTAKTPPPYIANTNTFATTALTYSQATEGTSVIDWLKSTPPVIKNVRGIKAIASDVMSKYSESISSTPLLAISRKPSTGQSVEKQNNFVASLAPGNLETLTKSLTINQVREETSKTMDEINDISCYSYCINPSLLTSGESNCIEITHSTEPQNKVPCENSDDTLLAKSDVGLYTRYLMESPTPLDNNTEMALTQAIVNTDIHYGTVDNIIGLKHCDLDLNYPEVNNLPFMSRALSNDPNNTLSDLINFGLIGEDFKFTLFEDISDL